MLQTAIKSILLAGGILLSVFQTIYGQNSFPLIPVSGADGTFIITTVEGVNVYRNDEPLSHYLYFPTDVPVHSTTVWVKITYFDIGDSEFQLEYNSTTNDYEPATSKIAADMQNTLGIRSAIFELPNADFRNAQNLGADLRIVAVPFIAMNIISATLFFQQPTTLSTPAPSFSMNSKILSTTVFHWYVPNGGQLVGPWRPIEGRENWTGEVHWWKSQIKQMMAANIDVIWVHLIPGWENIRSNLFRALYEMRAEGYDVPKVVPFLDPLITWNNQPNIDLGTNVGKDTLAAQYIRFFNQYFNANPDSLADDYLAKIDGRINLDTWHVHLNMDNISSLTRNDLESRLQAALAVDHPDFNNGIYMITTALSPQVFSFVDEKTVQFEVNDYFVPITFMGRTTVQLKAGYWDQNIRTPGDFLPRDGGVHFDSAWAQVDNSINRVYLESWNEYDEGTGHYAANPGPPFILPDSNNNNDVWSDSDDPYEYINTTSQGAALWNDVPENDAIILSHTLPDTMQVNEQDTSFVIVRNTGDSRWSGNQGYYFGQIDTGVPIFSAPVYINDLQDDIPTFGGIFRGRPKTFIIKPTAPSVTGTYVTKWSMGKDGLGWFGEPLELIIVVMGPSGIFDEGEITDYSVSQNYPNPFNPTTKIKFSIPKSTHVSLKVYDILGNEVATLVNEEKLAGNYEVEFDAGRLSSGIYFYKLLSGSFSQIKKMLLLK